MVIKSKQITIDDGPDAGKTFEITMPDAFRGEELFMRIMALCSGSANGNQIMQSLTSTNEGREIWNSLINLVKIVMPAATRKIDKEDIESPQTLIKLKSQALEMFMAFISE